MKHNSDLSRRHLIGALALTGIRSSAANSSITVGLIGCGDRGILVASLLVKNAGARLVALCDIFEDRIEQAKKAIPCEGARVYKDYRQLLSSDVDAVIIATPVFLQRLQFKSSVVSADVHRLGYGDGYGPTRRRLRPATTGHERMETEEFTCRSSRAPSGLWHLAGRRSLT